MHKYICRGNKLNRIERKQKCFEPNADCCKLEGNRSDSGEICLKRDNKCHFSEENNPEYGIIRRIHKLIRRGQALIRPIQAPLRREQALIRPEQVLIRREEDLVCGV